MDDNTKNIHQQNNWIKVEDGKFKCCECEHTVAPLTNTIDGIIDADLKQVTKDLGMYPGKITYAICPVCGMEYLFKLVDGKLLIEPSEEEK